MKQSKCSEEQIICAIRHAERGIQIGDLCLKKQYAHLCATAPASAGFGRWKKNTAG